MKKIRIQIKIDLFGFLLLCPLIFNFARGAISPAGTIYDWYNSTRPSVYTSSSGLTPNLYYLNQPNYAILSQKNSSLMWVADSGNHLIRIVPVSSNSKIQSVVAGTGNGFFIPNFTATDPLKTPLFYPSGLAINQNESLLFISDTKNHVVRVLNFQSNILMIIAGSGISGYSGDSGIPNQAKMNEPFALALDETKNLLYITENQNNLVRKLDLNLNQITTLIGGSLSFSTAQLFNPKGLLFDSTNQLLYISESTSNILRIWNFTSNSTLIVAGTGSKGNNGNNQVVNALNANFNSIQGISFDEIKQRIIIADSGNNLIRSYNPSNQTVFSYLTLNSTFNLPSFIVNFRYVLNSYKNLIEFVDFDNSITANIVGDFFSFSPNQGNGFVFVNDLTFTGSDDSALISDGSGNSIYVTTISLPLICSRFQVNEKYTQANIDRFLGTGSPNFGGLNFNQKTPFNNIGGMDLLEKDLFIADSQNHIIRKSSSYYNSNVTTLAGTPTISGFSGENTNNLSSILFNFPTDVKIKQIPTLQIFLYIVDSLNHKIRSIDLKNNLIKTIVGLNNNNTGSFSGDGFLALNGGLNTPTKISIDSKENRYYICDTKNNRIRIVDENSGIINTFAGNGNSGYNGDNILATLASLNQPMGISVHISSGDVYISDTFNSRIRKVSFSSSIITTFAGGIDSSQDGNIVPSTQGSLSFPTGLTFSPGGDLFISDSMNSRIRSILFTPKDLDRPFSCVDIVADGYDSIVVFPFVIIIIVVVFVAAVIIITIILVVILRKRKEKKNNQNQADLPFVVTNE